MPFSEVSSAPGTETQKAPNVKYVKPYKPATPAPAVQPGSGNLPGAIGNAQVPADAQETNASTVSTVVDVDLAAETAVSAGASQGTGEPIPGWLADEVQELSAVTFEINVSKVEKKPKKSKALTTREDKGACSGLLSNGSVTAEAAAGAEICNGVTSGSEKAGASSINAGTAATRVIQGFSITQAFPVVGPAQAGTAQGSNALTLGKNAKTADNLSVRSSASNKAKDVASKATRKGQSKGYIIGNKPFIQYKPPEAAPFSPAVRVDLTKNTPSIQRNGSAAIPMGIVPNIGGYKPTVRRRKPPHVPKRNTIRFAPSSRTPEKKPATPPVPVSPVLVNRHASRKNIAQQSTPSQRHLELSEDRRAKLAMLMDPGTQVPVYPLEKERVAWELSQAHRILANGGSIDKEEAASNDLEVTAISDKFYVNLSTMDDELKGRSEMRVTCPENSTWDEVEKELEIKDWEYKPVDNRNEKPKKSVTAKQSAIETPTENGSEKDCENLDPECVIVKETIKIAVPKTSRRPKSHPVTIISNGRVVHPLRPVDKSMTGQVSVQSLEEIEASTAKGYPVTAAQVSMLYEQGRENGNVFWIGRQAYVADVTGVSLEPFPAMVQELPEGFFIPLVVSEPGRDSEDDKTKGKRVADTLDESKRKQRRVIKVGTGSQIKSTTPEKDVTKDGSGTEPAQTAVNNEVQAAENEDVTHCVPIHPENALLMTSQDHFHGSYVDLLNDDCLEWDFVDFGPPELRSEEDDEASERSCIEEDALKALFWKGLGVGQAAGECNWDKVPQVVVRDMTPPPEGSVQLRGEDFQRVLATGINPNATPVTQRRERKRKVPKANEKVRNGAGGDPMSLDDIDDSDFWHQLAAEGPQTRDDQMVEMV
ncbi:hypothetical protein BDZ91DRAFT_793026 [Kalaharituber pfeilii]|nr:hypothetical protein BDZ91DRAFT_793026 [Kalaharituber pfeilii]